MIRLLVLFAAIGMCLGYRYTAITNLSTNTTFREKLKIVLIWILCTAALSGILGLILGISKNRTFPETFKIVSRMEWGAKLPLEGVNQLTESPVPYVIIYHTATKLHCFNQTQCAHTVRNIQDFHIHTKHWSDIGYNFLIGGDGNVYEGRGWGKGGAHTIGFNSRSVGIAFIGTFQTTKAPLQQVIACKYLIEKGVSLGYIAEDYKLLAARQLTSTISPGDELYKELVKWPHWSSAP